MAQEKFFRKVSLKKFFQIFFMYRQDKTRQDMTRHDKTFFFINQLICNLLKYLIEIQINKN